jgi:hypothetical protein
MRGLLGAMPTLRGHAVSPTGHAHGGRGTRRRTRESAIFSDEIRAAARAGKLWPVGRTNSAINGWFVYSGIGGVVFRRLLCVDGGLPIPS